MKDDLKPSDGRGAHEDIADLLKQRFGKAGAERDMRRYLAQLVDAATSQLESSGCPDGWTLCADHVTCVIDPLDCPVPNGK